MTALDDERLVLLLACETLDRGDAEQDAMLRLAARLDARANRDTVTNARDGVAWRLYHTVDQTRELVDDQKRRWNQKVADRLDAQAERWVAARCT